ncbi:MAG: hypothetical protein U0271_22125 [Polyangiaceae bacterium]
MQTADELERALTLAREELLACGTRLSKDYTAAGSDLFERQSQRCLSLERDLARSRNEQCAVPLEWSAPWDVGAPLPLVVSSGHRLFVVYRQREHDPAWDGSYAEMVDPASAEVRLIAIVEFHRCLIHRFGAPNDEALEGHALHGRGLEAYRAHTVERSSWLREQERINSVHRHHRPEAFAGFTHYVLPFHDETFECLADGHRIRESLSTFSEALQAVTDEVLR